MLIYTVWYAVLTLDSLCVREFIYVKPKSNLLNFKRPLANMYRGEEFSFTGIKGKPAIILQNAALPLIIRWLKKYLP